MLLPISMAVKRQSCIHRAFPLSHHRERHSNAPEKGGGMPGFIPTPNFSSPPRISHPHPCSALSPG